MRPLRVLFLTPWFPAKPGDREGNFVFDSVDSLAEIGVRCSVLVSRPWAPGFLRRWTSSSRADEPDAAAFPNIEQLDQVIHLSIPRNRLRAISNRLYDRRVLPRLSAMAARAGADIIHAHTEFAAASAMAVGRTTGTPVVVTLHGIDGSMAGLQRPLQKRRISSALEAADRVVLVGEPLRSFFRDYIGRDDHVRVVLNGCRIELVRRSTEVLAPGKPIRFISVSNLHRGKGVDVTLTALAELDSQGLSEWRYTIVGDGAERPALERLAERKRLGRRVDFIGAVPHGEVAALLANADVFVLPSHREAFGIAYLEAMASGLLTVGVQGQGPSAFIEDGRTGILVSPNDALDLAYRLASVFSDRVRMRAIAIAGAETARRDFSWRRHADRLLDVYRELVDVDGRR